MKGSGFAVNEDIEVILHSDPVVLGYPSADDAGDFSFTAHIPAGITPGEHTVIARGLESGVVATASITVLPAGAASTGVRDLASTGFAWFGVSLAIAGLTLLAGMIALIVSRRFRRPAAGDRA